MLFIKINLHGISESFIVLLEWNSVTYKKCDLQSVELERMVDAEVSVLKEQLERSAWNKRGDEGWGRRWCHSPPLPLSSLDIWKV